MARRKTLPESVRAKLALAERLAALRSELYGDRGGPEMARRLGIPVRTWYNYEGGVTVPAEVILKIIELTAVEAGWLLHGEEPKFRNQLTERGERGGQPAITVGALLRTALQLLEKNESTWPARDEMLTGSDQLEGTLTATNRFGLPYDPRSATDPQNVAITDRSGDETGARHSQSRTEWLAAQRDNRCIQVSGDSMAPILADGASVAYARNEEDLQHLDGKMVVTWVDGQPLVRWFQNCGRFALLRAENPGTVPQQVLVDLEDSSQRPRFRRVVGFNSPH
jgi:phage repressor protein C with HTH and peptisase S24 domain